MFNIVNINRYCIIKDRLQVVIDRQILFKCTSEYINIEMLMFQCQQQPQYICETKL